MTLLPERRIRVLAILPSFYPSTVVGVVKPLQRLHQGGWLHLDITLQYLATAAAIGAADVVVMCGEALAPTPRILKWIADSGRPLVFELDDNRLEVPAEIPGMDYARSPVQRNLVIECLRAAAAVRVYSPYLKELVKPYSENVALVNGPVEWDLVATPPAARRTDITRIVYATSRMQDRIGEMLVAPLKEVLAQFPQVELTIWGPPHALANQPRVRHRQFLRNYERFFRQFSREHFDIGLAPLPDDAFHRGKSNNKFREYAACEIAGVYSDMPVYNTSVAHGRTGLLVPDDPGSWFNAIASLVTNPLDRQQIAQQAHHYAREHYSNDATRDSWMNIFVEVRQRGLRPRVSVGSPAAMPNGAPSSGIAKKVVAAARFGARRAAWRRLTDYGTSVAQIIGWRLRRRSIP